MTQVGDGTGAGVMDMLHPQGQGKARAKAKAKPAWAPAQADSLHQQCTQRTEKAKSMAQAARWYAISLEDHTVAQELHTCVLTCIRVRVSWLMHMRLQDGSGL